MADETETSAGEQSALTDEEWALVESAQQKLAGEEQELSPEEEAAVEKAIEAGELDLEEE